MTQINLFIRQKQTHRHRKQTYGLPKGKRGQGGFEINRLLYLK